MVRLRGSITIRAFLWLFKALTITLFPIYRGAFNRLRLSAQSCASNTTHRDSLNIAYWSDRLLNRLKGLAQPFQTTWSGCAGNTDQYASGYEADNQGTGNCQNNPFHDTPPGALNCSSYIVQEIRGKEYGL
jgi:hypothetical protein